jgi:phosphoglycerate kinase
LADRLLVGGAIANALLEARGICIGRSVSGGAAVAKSVRRIARSKKVVLPVDAVVTRSTKSRRVRMVPIHRVGAEEVIADIGPKSCALFRREIRPARTVVWNGPMGLSEAEEFSRGTRGIARALASSQARVVVGGGDTVAFLERAKLLAKFKHVSTGGGAMLAYLTGEKLPALEALKRSAKINLRPELRSRENQNAK